MKKLLIVCGAGHATSTIAVAKVSAWLEKEGYSDKVKIYQSKIADELNKIDDYDAVISTTIVPDSIKDKVIQGLPLLNGMGVDQVYDQLKTRLGLKNGCVVISSAHTTCSLYFDECMHDTNYWGDEYLQADINDVMEKIAPSMKMENQYHSPGPKHIEFGLSLGSKDYPAEKWTMLNTDAHLKSSIFGSPSLTFIVKDGEIQLGALGKVYFVDWDQLRERTRKVQIMVMGE